jgi:ubiquitin thioesterase protein OTUB1
MGDVPQAPHAAGGGEEWAGPDPNPSPSLGGCSDPVSVELSMGGDYYRACCGEPDPDIPEGPKLPCVGDKVREGGRASPLSPTILTCPRSGIG